VPFDNIPQIPCFDIFERFLVLLFNLGFWYVIGPYIEMLKQVIDGLYEIATLIRFWRKIGCKILWPTWSHWYDFNFFIPSMGVFWLKEFVFKYINEDDIHFQVQKFKFGVTNLCFHFTIYIASLLKILTMHLACLLEMLSSMVKLITCGWLWPNIEKWHLNWHFAT
jgi:hypothetical protein